MEISSLWWFGVVGYPQSKQAVPLDWLKKLRKRNKKRHVLSTAGAVEGCSLAWKAQCMRESTVVVV